MLEDYYVDELLLVLDAYADMHKTSDDQGKYVKEVYADQIEGGASEYE